MEISNLSKEEKLELLKRIQSGEVHVVNGEIIEATGVLIQKEGKYFAGGIELTSDEVDEVYKDRTVVILPAKNPVPDQD